MFDKNKVKLVKFSDIATGFDYGMNSSAIEYDGKNKYIRITDIEEGSGTYDPSKFVSPDGKLQNKYLVKDGDILLARTGASVGKSYLSKKKIENLYFAGFLIRASITNADPDYIYQFLQTEKYNKFVIINSARSGQPGLNAEEYANLEIPVPSTIEEQVKIGKLLSSIDELIEMNENLVKNFELKKRFELKKLVTPKKNSTKKLDDICLNFSSSLSMTNVLDDGKYPVYGANSLVGFNDKHKIEDDYIEVVKDGAGVGRVFHLPARSYVLGTMMILKPNDRYNASYVKVVMENINFDNYISGSTIPHLYFKDIKKIKISDEINTHLIGNYFNSSDLRIESTRKLVVELKKQKQYYLNQIFN